MNAENQQNSIRIAVRTLAETVHRRGGLAGPEYGGVTAADGTRLHQRFVALLTERHAAADGVKAGSLRAGAVKAGSVKADCVKSEVFLQGDYQLGEPALLVSGRCDAVVGQPGPVEIIEAKSFIGAAERLPRDGEPVHWA